MINEAELYKQIGARLKAIRTGSSARQLTQERLAVIVGLERTSITNIEAGKQRVPLHIIYLLCSALGVEITEVLPSCEEVTVRIPDETIKIGAQAFSLSPQIAELVRNAE